MSTDNFWTDELVAEFFNYLHPSIPNWLEERIKDFKNLNNRKMTQLTDKHWAIQVPDDAQDFIIQPHYVRNAIDERDQGRIVWFDYRGAANFKIIPHPNFDFLFTTKEATEEQSASIVQVISNGKITGRPQYRRYDRDLSKDTPAKCWTRDSRHSMETLLISKGLNPDNNHAIIKNNTNNANP